MPLRLLGAGILSFIFRGLPMITSLSWEAFYHRLSFPVNLKAWPIGDVIGDAFVCCLVYFHEGLSLCSQSSNGIKPGENQFRIVPIREPSEWIMLPLMHYMKDLHCTTIPTMAQAKRIEKETTERAVIILSVMGSILSEIQHKSKNLLCGFG